MSISEPNSAEISHILGVDFGRSKIGLAMADNETEMAFAYDTLKNGRDFIQKLTSIIRKESVNKIIIGIPSYVNKKSVKYEGDPAKFTEKKLFFSVNHGARKLGELIKRMFPDIDIEYQDEMFTTKIAQNNLIAKGIKGIKKYDDVEAARIILQEWLDNKKTKD